MALWSQWVFHQSNHKHQSWPVTYMEVSFLRWYSFSTFPHLYEDQLILKKLSWTWSDLISYLATTFSLCMICYLPTNSYPILTKSYPNHNTYHICYLPILPTSWPIVIESITHLLSTNHTNWVRWAPRHRRVKKKSKQLQQIFPFPQYQYFPSATFVKTYIRYISLKYTCTALCKQEDLSNDGKISKGDTNEMVRGTLEIQSWHPALHHQVCAGCIFSFGNVPVYNLEHMGPSWKGSHLNHFVGSYRWWNHDHEHYIIVKQFYEVWSPSVNVKSPSDKKHCIIGLS